MVLLIMVRYELGVKREWKELYIKSLWLGRMMVLECRSRRSIRDVEFEKGNVGFRSSEGASGMFQV